MEEGKDGDQLMWREENVRWRDGVGMGRTKLGNEAEEEQTLVTLQTRTAAAGELSQTRTASHGFVRESGQEVVVLQVGKSHMVFCLFAPRVQDDVTWQ